MWVIKQQACSNQPEMKKFCEKSEFASGCFPNSLFFKQIDKILKFMPVMPGRGVRSVVQQKRYPGMRRVCRKRIPGVVTATAVCGFGAVLFERA
ncbi:hypothetical protein [Pseudomonas syringae]|uniref:hypothetical protein n=1 Tax=Pseudomonas syringae TaxID=317 RepID=UPI0015C466F0|nr:hypothetical protein [Pseudomonas syringae]